MIYTTTTHLVRASPYWKVSMATFIEDQRLITTMMPNIVAVAAEVEPANEFAGLQAAIQGGCVLAISYAVVIPKGADWMSELDRTLLKASIASSPYSKAKRTT